MIRYVHPALLAELQRGATTLCTLLLIRPVTPGMSPYGLTDTNQSVRYNPGTGEVLFSAPIGFEASLVEAQADLSVANAEARSLMPVYDVPVSEELINAGQLDYAEFALYLVNYEDLTTGRHITLQEGTIGKVSVRDDGLSFINELRGLAAQLKQEVCSKYTKTCRAIEGTQELGSLLPGPQVRRDWCGVDFTVYLKTSTVSAVGLENTLNFRIDPGDVDSEWDVNAFVPGRVIFTTGRNAGRTLEIMGNTADGWITLRHEAGFPIEVDDELEYRVGCTFIARDAEKGCLAHAGSGWIDVFKGYPDIPTENADQLSTPGAAVGPAGGGGTSVPYATVEA
ncbi:DUF2163 domain-containing protein [Marilutibacter spongiae]|uniref:DUF2163 domain-containing protein n=1 Tax=Marilutibacter spongiae TaxID=2025720 RepID=A0A7W3Y5G4_9GAMM|nr:DUF2163 domain-containing protein [Lysobacter spongiae]MBB1060433.1 DUF2163 domain-containing protein [Lysobacter spongiae]